MKVYLKVGAFYTGVSPTAIAGKIGDAQFPLYWNRPGEPNAGGAWELVELEPQADGLFRATYVESGRVLSIQNDGGLQTRPAGTVGLFELLRATSQPEGLDILYREDSGKVLGVPLTIEAA